jgi:hypothetical protein
VLSIVVNIVSLENYNFKRKVLSYLGIFAAFEKWGHTDEADIIVPHDGVLGVVPRNSEDILKDCTA